MTGGLLEEFSKRGLWLSSIVLPPVDDLLLV
jgi:hypothetical protein